MSKLPNAPLIEVIFEIRWQIINQSDLVDFQYLHGDLYSILKEQYPIRENLIPPEIPHDVLRGAPVYRFRKEQKGYPLFQLGPGLLSINITDDKYYWDSFEQEINKILDAFVKAYPKSDKLKFIPSLSYIDFFELKTDANPMDFVNQNLYLKIEQNFIDESTNNNNEELSLMLNYKLEQNLLSLNIKKGTYNKLNGLLLHSKIIGENEIYSRESLTKWINESHLTMSKVFEKIIKNNLFETFK